MFTVYSLKQYSLSFLILAGLTACGQSAHTDTDEVSRLYWVDNHLNANTAVWRFCYQQPSRNAAVVFDLRAGDELLSVPAPMPLGRSGWLYARPANNEKAAACYVRRQHVQTVQSAAVSQ